MDGVIDEKTILTRVQAEIEARLNEDNAFIHPYSLSLDTITNCLTTLSNEKILVKTRRYVIVGFNIKLNLVFPVKTVFCMK